MNAGSLKRAESLVQYHAVNGTQTDAVELLGMALRQMETDRTRIAQLESFIQGADPADGSNLGGHEFYWESTRAQLTVGLSDPWTVTEAINYHGFFLHGWESAIKHKAGKP